MKGLKENNMSTLDERIEERFGGKNDFLKKPKESSHIKKVIGIASGKGGVGKSLVSAMLAAALRQRGLSVAVLDADITGPSMARTFGLDPLMVTGDKEGINPVITETGIKVMSCNLLVEKETDPVVWRGALLSSMVTQFWTDVYWGDVDVMLIDLPLGTGDVVLTVYQSIPVNGIVVVSTPQELVGMIVEKAINMAGMVNIPVIGMVENMSYVRCPDCGRRIDIFGKSHLDELAKEHKVTHTARLPMDPQYAEAIDRAYVEQLEVPELNDIVEAILEI
jgi:Mrp family chromosome partitioning ATPase